MPLGPCGELVVLQTLMHLGSVWVKHTPLYLKLPCVFSSCHFGPFLKLSRAPLLLQLAAEAQAVVQLREKGDHPLLILPFKSMIDYDVGAFTISPFAGASAAAMRANDWALLSNIELKELCKEMVICLLCTQLNFGFKVSGMMRE